MTKNVEVMVDIKIARMMLVVAGFTGVDTMTDDEVFVATLDRMKAYGATAVIGEEYMKINGYELTVICANYDKNTKCYGDIYDCVEDCIEAHPDDEIIYGYHLNHLKDNVETPDWFNTIEEAINWASLA